MKIWIVHDSLYGNGKKLAETLGKVFEKKAEVKIEHIKNISPKKVVEDSPNAVIIGTAVRAFMTSFASKKWARNLKSELKKSKKTIKYGAVFVTHGMSKKAIDFRGNRFRNIVKSGNVITNLYPEWLSGQVATAEGPFKEGELEKIEKQGKDILQWMK